MTTTDWQAPALQALAETAGRELEGKTPVEILTWAFDTFGDSVAIASSMADSLVIHVASKIRDDVPVVFLDTGFHFPETIGTRDAVAQTYPIKLLSITPVQSVPEQEAEFGKDLYLRDPDLCCAMRKVEPLQRGLEPYTAWVSGIRRDETANRQAIGVVEWDAKRGKVKINPFAAWTQDEVDEYMELNGVLVNPLVSEGYTSIGCTTCTAKPVEGADVRAGRWAGSAKTECGLHT
ncbi:MAG: adenylylsulfate reductase, thioredoxin dependent [Frankiales bacterium]|nr:adenylylsulfate reductase, thioredoxin dependent [Frankiales bacterium]